MLYLQENSQFDSEYKRRVQDSSYVGKLWVRLLARGSRGDIGSRDLP